MSNKIQPNPTPNANQPVWEQVISDMQERNQIGIRRYKMPLQAFNGRNALMNAYQEALDLSVCLKQRIIEDAVQKPLAIVDYLVSFCDYLKEKQELVAARQVTITISDEKADEIIALVKELSSTPKNLHESGLTNRTFNLLSRRGLPIDKKELPIAIKRQHIAGIGKETLAEIERWCNEST